jgi:molybdate transport system substrate-binding protein
MCVLLAIAIAACSSAASAGSGSAAQSLGASATELQVYAAASLKAVLATVKQAYESTHAGVVVTVSTDSSAALETKIEQGAPADVFLSADMANPQKLVDEGLASASGVTTFARNVLTIIVPTSNPGRVESPRDLARRGVKVIAAGDTVPITRYAQQLVGNLVGQPGYPSNFASAYAANIVSKEDNVAAVVSKIELGEGDAAIVYATDAKSSSNVTIVDVPRSANVPVDYGGVVVRGSPHQDAAAQFLAWLTSADARATFAEFGFLPAR